MADVKISALPAAASIADADLVALVQGGVTKRGTAAMMRAAPGSTTQVIFNDAGALAGDAGMTYAKATDVLSLVGALALGSGTPSTSALVRLATNSGSILATRNPGNTGNREIINASGTVLTFGDAADLWSTIDVTAGNGGTARMLGFNILLYAYNAFGVAIDCGGGTGIKVTDTTISAGLPVIGNSAASSPYGAVNGTGVQAMADANQTPSASVYVYATIKTTGAITANRNLTIPAATDAAGYGKWIDNTCTGAFSVVVKDSGAGTTATVANGTKGFVWMDSRGATLMTAVAAAAGSLAVYGDGSDGAAVADGATAVAGCSLAASVYTMTRDIFPSSVVVSNGVTIKTNGYRIVCSGTCTVNSGGIVDRNGIDAVLSVAAAAIVQGSLAAAAAGGAGIIDSLGGAGGSGGAGTLGAGNAGGTVTAIVAAYGSLRSLPFAAMGCAIGMGTTAAAGGEGSYDNSAIPGCFGARSVRGGAGGGAGTKDNIGEGGTTVGRGGSGGGVMILIAQTIANSGTIRANGGVGGAASSTGSGGGGGGGGGVLITISRTFTGTTPTVNGGAGGAGGGGAGVAGATGAAGTLIQLTE